MIRFLNGYCAEYFVASGALAFDGKGWWWEWPLRWLGLIDTSLFAVVMKTVTREPRKGNLRWWKPWECVRLIPDGVVNKVGLTNPGADWWCEKVGLRVDRKDIALVGSISGTVEELLGMTGMLTLHDLVALEVNVSCPNVQHDEETAAIIKSIREVAGCKPVPIIAKLSVAQDYIAIARGLMGFADAISLNSVPWEIAFPGKPSPLARLQTRVGGGGGGVSGKAAQPFLWPAVARLCREIPEIPVIAPSTWNYGDMEYVRSLGAKAVSFGAIHLRTPWRPTAFVRRARAEEKRFVAEAMAVGPVGLR